MKRTRIFRALRFAVFFAIAFVVFGLAVTHLWNHLMVSLFHFPTITFWQALGLMILARLLFGGFRGRPGGWHWRKHMMMRWDQMTPEQREKFREGMRSRWGHSAPPASEPKP